MSRIIKFRAWSKTRKKMLDRVLAGPGDPCSIVWIGESREWVQFDEFCGDLMQFTGLLDTNDKEIYEGDIVRIIGLFGDEHLVSAIAWKQLEEQINFWANGETWTVSFKGYKDRMKVAALGPYCNKASGFTVSIIGNIYEHPELITQ